MNKNTHTRGTTQNAPARYLKFLQELEHLITSETPFVLSRLVAKHQISRGVPAVLKEAGIISKVNRSYVWNSIKPNIKMATKTVDEVSRKVYKSIGKTHPITPVDLFNQKVEAWKSEILTPVHPAERMLDPVSKPKQTRIRQPAKIQKTISLFWGLITFKF